ncbi:MAG: hypothetical protein HOP11_04420 [Saprospiraceae bacterium]|nr:hypothetical protein [Saprospiraceae bacterium]
MNRKETDLLIKLLIVGYSLNFLFGMLGSFFEPQSYGQMTSWMLGDSMAIFASVLASRYIGFRGQNIAAAGYTSFGIAYGVSFASSAINAVNEEKMATIILPLVPAVFLISFCKIFPGWLRFGGLLICIPFFLMYKHVIQGTYKHEDLSNLFAYVGIQVLGLLWSYFMYKDNVKQKSNEKNN